MSTNTEHLLFDDRGIHEVSSPTIPSGYVCFKNGSILTPTNFIFEKRVDSNVDISFLKIESDASQINLSIIDSDLPEILSALLLIVHDANTAMNLSDVLNILITANPLEYNLSYGHPMYEYKIRHLLSCLTYNLLTTELWNSPSLRITGAVIEQENGSKICCHIYNPNKFIVYLVDHIIIPAPTEIYNEDNSNLLSERNTQLILPLKFAFL